MVYRGPNEWHLGNLHQPWEVWGPTPDTLTKIHASCRSQEGPEEANLFTPTSQLLLKIKQTCQLDRIHGLTAVSVPAFFPSSSKNDECWWGTRDPSTVYVWDSMEDQDKQSSMEALRHTEKWVIWKTKDEIWKHTLKRECFHQILSLDKDTKANTWEMKSRDGGEEETSKSQNTRKYSNVGWNPLRTYHKKHKTP